MGNLLEWPDINGNLRRFSESKLVFWFSLSTIISFHFSFVRMSVNERFDDMIFSLQREFVEKIRGHEKLPTLLRRTPLTPCVGNVYLSPFSIVSTLFTLVVLRVTVEHSLVFLVHNPLKRSPLFDNHESFLACRTR